MEEIEAKLARAKSLAGKGKVSRRDFVQLALAAGFTVTAAHKLFVRAAHAEPKKGGHFVNSLTGGASTDVLDPAWTLDAYMTNVSFGQLRNNLTEIAPDGTLRGELAEEWEASPDAKTWTFKLRDGVTFHSGKSLDAEDVVASFNHHRGKGNTSAASAIVRQIKDVKANGKSTVVFSLIGGNAEWPFIVSDYHLCICPAKDGKMDWQSGDGTGGYSLVSFEPGISTKVKRNPNYWKENAAYFDSVDNLFVPNAVARLNGVRSGSIDSMSNVDLKTLRLMQKDPNLQFLAVNGNKQATFPMLCTVPPFNKVDVRLAIKYAIKRQELVDKVLGGQGEIANDTPIGPANIYRATKEELPQREYDPERAKFHLKRADMEKLKVKLHISEAAFEGAVAAAELIAESAKGAGIDVQVVLEANDGYWTNIWLKQGWCGSYAAGRVTEDWIFSQLYSKTAEWNESRWDNDKFNELLIQARSELDPKKRRELYVEMQRIVNKDSGVLIPVFMAFTHAVSRNIGLPEKIANNWELDGHKNAERWWFA